MGYYYLVDGVLSLAAGNCYYCKVGHHMIISNSSLTAFPQNNPLMINKHGSRIRPRRLISICAFAVFTSVLVRAESDPATQLPHGEFEIVGFYGAANNGGTFVRTVEKVPIRVGDSILVSGTEYYDGTWTVTQAFPYKDPRDSQLLWGYRIEPKWRGFPPGFTIDGGMPADKTASLKPLPSR